MSKPVNYDPIIVRDPPIYDFTLYTPRLNIELWPQARDLDPPDSNDWFRKLTNQMGHSYPGVNMSTMNLNVILNILNLIKQSAKLIVEIGVMPNMDVPNSTKLFLQEKKSDCKYLGIDIENREYILKYGFPNVHLLQTDSKNTDLIIAKIKELGGEIDFLFIDGLHTIEQVKYELALIPYVKKGGVIAFHDIMCHIGPNVWMKAFDPNKFSTITSFVKYDDWGVGLLMKDF
jgi:hypothetical protein